MPVHLSDSLIYRNSWGTDAARAIFDDEQTSLWMNTLLPEGAGEMRTLLRPGETRQPTDPDAPVVDHPAPSPPSAPSANLKVQPDPEEAATRTAPAPAIVQEPRTPTVLAVDDSPTGLALLDTYLAREGYRVLKSTSAREVLAVLDREDPALETQDPGVAHDDLFQMDRGGLALRCADRGSALVLLQRDCELSLQLIHLLLHRGQAHLELPRRPRFFHQPAD